MKTLALLIGVSIFTYFLSRYRILEGSFHDKDHGGFNNHIDSGGDEGDE